MQTRKLGGIVIFKHQSIMTYSYQPGPLMLSSKGLQETFQGQIMPVEKPWSTDLSVHFHSSELEIFFMNWKYFIVEQVLIF